MKKTLILAVPVLIWAQNRPQSFDMHGLRLAIGMSKTDVEKIFSGHHQLQCAPAADKEVLGCVAMHGPATLGNVRFRQGKLETGMKMWFSAPEDNDARHYATALYGAFDSAAKSGARTCRLEVGGDVTKTGTIRFFCGKKTIDVVVDSDYTWLSELSGSDEPKKTGNRQ
jgi:hypothetical protein